MIASESNLLSLNKEESAIQERISIPGTGVLKSVRIHPLEEERIEDEENSSSVFTARVSEQIHPHRNDSSYKDQVEEEEPNKSPAMNRNLLKESKTNKPSIWSELQRQQTGTVQSIGLAEDYVINDLNYQESSPQVFSARQLLQKKSFIRMFNGSKKTISELNRQFSMKSPLINSKRIGELPIMQTKVNRRAMEKSTHGRATYLNLQQSQQVPESNEQENQNEDFHGNMFLPNNLNPQFLIHKKLSISWRFINILVLIQTFTKKIKHLGQFYRFAKLNEVHYRFVNDQSHYLGEKSSKNTVKNKLKSFQEWISEMKIIKNLEFVQVFKPEQLIVILWKTFIFAVLISQLIYIPIKIAFFNFNMGLSNVNQILLNRLPFAACLFDMLVNFNLAFFSAEGVVISDRSGIIKNYLRFPFWLDLVTTVSLMLQDLQFTDLCFLLRVFQIGEIVSYLDERFQFSQRFNTFFTLIKLIATIIVVAHIFGCGFYYMSLQNSEYNWVKSLSGELPNPPWGTLYVKSLYFIIITMITVGFGDITPKNNAETVYVLGIALLSCFQFGYTVNVIGSLFQEKAQQQAIIKAQKFQISTYMRQRMISKSLQMLVLKNLDYIQNQQIDSPEQGLSILEKVSENLRNNVRFDFYWRILKQQPILNHYFSKGFLKALTKVMTERAYIPGEFIYTLNQLNASNSFFILLKGQIDLTLQSFQERESKKKFIVLHKKTGDLFGHFSFFTSQPRETDCECAIAAHLISCSQADFLAVAKDFPKDYEKFCYVRDSIMLYQRDKDMKCLACGKYGHFVIDCPFIHLTNYRSLVIGKHNYSEEQRRRGVFERSQRKHTSLTSIDSVRHSLKKIRIKYIEKSQRDKERRIMMNDDEELLHPQNNETNKRERDEEWNLSCDTSDISDYKYELEIEQEQRKMKRETGEMGRLLAASDKYFYHSHPCIQFCEKQVFTFSTDELSSFSENEDEEEEEQVILQQKGEQQGDLKRKLNDQYEEDTQILEKFKENQIQGQKAYSVLHQKNSCKSCFNNENNGISTPRSGFFKPNSNQEQTDTSNILAEGHKLSPNHKGSTNDLLVFHYKTPDNLHSITPLSYQCDTPRTTMNASQQRERISRQRKSFNLKRSSMDSANFINQSQKYFKRDSLKRHKQPKREQILENQTQQEETKRKLSTTTPVLQLQNPVDKVSNTGALSQQDISVNRQKKRFFARHNSLHSIRFSSQLLISEEEIATDSCHEKSTRDQQKPFESQAGKKIGVARRTSSNTKAENLIESQMQEGNGLDTPANLQARSQESSLLSINKEVSIDEERSFSRSPKKIEEQSEKYFNEGFNEKQLNILSEKNEGNRQKLFVFGDKKQFITKISRKVKPKMDAIRHALLDKTKDQDCDGDKTKAEKNLFQTPHHRQSAPFDNFLYQKDPENSSKNNPTILKMKMALQNPEKPHSASVKRDNHDVFGQIYPQDRVFDPAIFIQHSKNSNNSINSQQILPVSSNTLGFLKQTNNTNSIRPFSKYNKNNNNSSSNNINPLLTNKPIRRQATIFLGESNRTNRKTLNIPDQNIFGQTQQNQQLQVDNVLKQLQQFSQPLLQQQEQQIQPLEYQNQQEQQLPQQQQKQPENTSTKQPGINREIEQQLQEEHEEFEIPDFEKPKCYSVYYPHNNLTHVLESLSKYQFKMLVVSRLQLGIQKKSTGQLSSQQSINVNAIPKQLNISSLMKRLMTKH